MTQREKPKNGKRKRRPTPSKSSATSNQRTNRLAFTPGDFYLKRVISSLPIRNTLGGRMRTALTILVLATVVGGSFGSAGEAAPERDTEQLFADLRNDQFDVRKKAAEELCRHAGQLWERLKKIS